MFKWVEGRQGSGYLKKKLFESKRFKFDCYLLKYEEGSFIDWHTDPVDGYKHYRLNIILKKADKGGYSFLCGNSDYIFIRKFNITFFRPDKILHSVSKVFSGTRYVLSIGWLLNEND